MSGIATEGLQPVSDFLPPKPPTDPTDASDLTPVNKAETSVPGFPSEPKLDAPTEAADANMENFQSNATLSARSDIAPEAPSTNGATPLSDPKSRLNGMSTSLESQPSLPAADDAPTSQNSAPVPEELPLQESSSSANLPTTTASSFPTQPSLDLATQPTQLSPPIEQAPTSDLRTEPDPIPQDSELAQRIKEEKHLQDLKNDPELAAAESSTAPVENLVEPTVAAVTETAVETTEPLSSDQMDTVADQAPAAATQDVVASIPQPEPVSLPIEQPAAPAPTPAIPAEAAVEAAPAVPAESIPSATTESAPVFDEIMTDAPPAAQKVAREREEEVDEERASKRAKVENDGAVPEFKVPALPTTESAAPAQSTTATDSSDQMTLPRIKALNKAIQSAKKVHCSRFFKAPVDWVTMKIPSYPEIIKEPMDLSTIEKKLKAIPSQYSTVAAFSADVDLMVTNALRFNGAEHIVVKEGRELQQRLLNEVANLPPVDFEEPTKADKKAHKVKIEPSRSVPARRQSNSNAGATRSPSTATGNQSFALNPDGVPLIRRDSTVTDGRPKRAIHPPKRRDEIGGGRPKKKKFEWQLKFCRETMIEMRKPKFYTFAQYFYTPVDPVALNIPNYFSVIKKPMDLDTIESKLNNNEYEKAKDFEDDVRQIFKNCYKFNMEGDFVYNCGQQLEKVFDDKWATKDDWLDNHEPQSKSATPDSDSEEEEEEEEDEEDSEAERNDKLQQLQKQIEMMSKQMGELANAKKKKKPTPPAPAKKTKKSGSKKDKSSASFPALSGVKKEKSSKSKKAEKERFVSYNEKQYISAGISSLPDSKMSEALRIIQSNVPALKNTHETEIELDIDELPNHVLLKLLAFVKRFVPHAPEPEPEKNYSGTATSSSGKPKKNKPMSKHEQEAQIEELKGRLGKYGGDQASPEPVQSIEQGDSSGDDSDTEESEEE